MIQQGGCLQHTITRGWHGARRRQTHNTAARAQGAAPEEEHGGGDWRHQQVRAHGAGRDLIEAVSPVAADAAVQPHEALFVILWRRGEVFGWFCVAHCARTHCARTAPQSKGAALTKSLADCRAHLVGAAVDQQRLRKGWGERGRGGAARLGGGPVSAPAGARAARGVGAALQRGPLAGDKAHQGRARTR